MICFQCTANSKFSVKCDTVTFINYLIFSIIHLLLVLFELCLFSQYFRRDAIRNLVGFWICFFFFSNFETIRNGQHKCSHIFSIFSESSIHDCVRLIIFSTCFRNRILFSDQLLKNNYYFNNNHSKKAMYKAITVLKIDNFFWKTLDQLKRKWPIYSTSTYGLL